MSLGPSATAPANPLAVDLMKRIESNTSAVREIASCLEMTAERFFGPTPQPSSSPKDGGQLGQSSVLGNLNDLEDAITRLRIAANRIA